MNRPAFFMTGQRICALTPVNTSTALQIPKFSLYGENGVIIVIASIDCLINFISIVYKYIYLD